MEAYAYISCKANIMFQLQYAPFIFKMEINGSVEHYGFCVEIMNALARIMNFTYVWLLLFLIYLHLHALIIFMRNL